MPGSGTGPRPGGWETLISGLPVLQFFSTFFHKRQYLKKKNALNIKRAFWFSLQLLSEAFLILRRTEWDMIKNVYWSLCEVLFILLSFWRNLDFLGRFSKNAKISNVINVRPIGAELFHSGWLTYGQTRHDEAKSRSSQFCERASNGFHLVGAL